MIDFALNNIWLLGAALVIGIVTGRWAFSSRKAPPAPDPKTRQEDESQP
jgi:hypothetical protein